MIVESDSKRAAPTDEVVKPEVPAGAEGEAVTLAGEETPAQKKPSRRERAVKRATQPLLERIRQLEAGQTQQTPQTPQAAQAETKTEPGAAPPKPKRANYADDEAFEDALVQWGNEKYAAEKAVADANAAQRQYLERNLRSYAAQVKQAKERYGDWNDVVNQDIFIGGAAQLAILELENATDVVHFLGTHPEYAEKLGQMPATAAILEVGQLSSSLKAASGNGNGYEYRRPKPKIPAPVQPVGSGTPSGEPTFAEIAQRANYPGKARDLRIALASGKARAMRD